tara:strand:+ start:3986 stop:4099 length:114 start_codon:yes stop_codon:yes gene_type:complete
MELVNKAWNMLMTHKTKAAVALAAAVGLWLLRTHGVL